MSRTILASASPRRKELLSVITKDFEVMTADVDERAIELKILAEHDDMVEAGIEMTKALGTAKAGAILNELKAKGEDDVIVIGADTCVVTNDEILGKPVDRADCVRMLTKLSGITHYVITGVTIMSGEKTVSFADVSEVCFYDKDEYQLKKIEEYADMKEPYDKAGSYGIQGYGMMLIKEIKGDYYNIMGLPVARLARELWTL